MVRNKKLSTSQRENLRQRLRKLIEEGRLVRGEQSKLARQYRVSRAYVHQIAQDERLRFNNPVGWEYQRARKSKQRVKLAKLVKKFADHPALQTHN